MKKFNKKTIFDIFLFIGIIILLNALAVRFFMRVDLTTSKLYSLSNASKNIAGSIQDKLIIRAYFSSDLPGQYSGIERHLRDMLEDYKAYSRGRIDYKFINPGTEEELAKEAQSFGIPPQQVQTVAQDKIEVKRVYMGLAFISGDRKESIASFRDLTNAEYEITSLIHRLTTERRPVLGIASIGFARDRANMQRLYEALGRIYDLRPVELDMPIEDFFDGLFIVAPRRPLTEWELFNIDQYIMRGGKTAFFLNSYATDFENDAAYRVNLNVNPFLINYGIAIGDDVLLDRRSRMVTIDVAQGFHTTRQQVPFFFMPNVMTFNRDNLITRDLHRVATFFPSSVDTTLAESMGYEIEGLIYSSERTGRTREDAINFNPAVMMRLPETFFRERHIPIAAVVSGRFKSFFAETGPPRTPDGTPYDGIVINEAPVANRMVVMGDGYMFLDEFLNDERDLLMIQNTADWLLQSEDLITIRAKQLPMVPLRDVSSFTRNAVKWLNRIGPMGIVIVLGIFVWQFRRIRNKALTASYISEVNK